MNKTIYFLAALLLAFASADATSRTSSRAQIQIVYQPLANGDFRLSLYGSDRTLVCEEKPIQIVQQGDAVNPVIMECKH